ncbi:DUF969 family protein [Sorangium sp. So ce315]
MDPIEVEERLVGRDDDGFACLVLHCGDPPFRGHAGGAWSLTASPATFVPFAFRQATRRAGRRQARAAERTNHARARGRCPGRRATLPASTGEEACSRSSTGRLLLVYFVIRQLSAALGLTSLGGHAQMVRPLIAPMAEGAAENRYGPLPDWARWLIRASAAAADNVAALLELPERDGVIKAQLPTALLLLVGNTLLLYLLVFPR